MRKSLALLLGFMMLIFTGCGLAEKAVEKAAEKAVEKATGVSVDEKGNSVTIKGQDGKSVTFEGQDNGKLPEGYPLPMVPGGKVVSSSKMSSDGKVGWIVGIEFKGDVKAVADLHENALKKLNVKVTRSEVEEDGHMTIMLMADGEKQSGIITIESDTKTGEGSVNVMFGDR
ncbi:MAG: hypothetical protein ACOY94_26845 [Bacillota bacterium]